MKIGRDKMLTINEIELKITHLKQDLNDTKSKTKKKAIEKEVKQLIKKIDTITAYEKININDTVINGDPNKFGLVFDKEIQNNLPMIWVDWNGIKISSVPNCLTVIDPKQLKWHWVKGEYTRLYDHKPCDDLQVLNTELQRLQSEAEILKSPSSSRVPWANQIRQGRSSYSVTSLPQQRDCTSGGNLRVPHAQEAIALNQQQQDSEGCSRLESISNRCKRIVQLWQDAIAFQYPLDSEFFYHGNKVTVNSYQLSQEHNLVFPLVVEGKNRYLIHPLELDTKQETNNLLIDQEFQNLLRPLTKEEYSQLEKNLIREQCPVVTVWKDRNIIIDGHHSYAIALEHNIPYTVREVELDSRSHVINWMYELQFGRRNLTPKEQSYYRAKYYKSLKQEMGGDRRSQQYQKEKSKPHNEGVIQTPETSLSTAEKIAQKTGVSRATIERDVKLIDTAEEVANKINVPVGEILNSKLSKKEILELEDQPPEIIKEKLYKSVEKKIKELPKLKVRQLVQIKSDRTNPDLVGYNKSYAVITALNGASADIQIWQKKIIGVHIQFLVPVEAETITIPLTLDVQWLVNLMEAFDSLEDAITPF